MSVFRDSSQDGGGLIAVRVPRASGGDLIQQDSTQAEVGRCVTAIV